MWRLNFVDEMKNKKKFSEKSKWKYKITKLMESSLRTELRAMDVYMNKEERSHKQNSFMPQGTIREQ